jgi:hypothetical protein
VLVRAVRKQHMRCLRCFLRVGHKHPPCARSLLRLTQPQRQSVQRMWHWQPPCCWNVLTLWAYRALSLRCHSWWGCQLQQWQSAAQHSNQNISVQLYHGTRSPDAIDTNVQYCGAGHKTKMLPSADRLLQLLGQAAVPACKYTEVVAIQPHTPN